jgi:carbohydrate kinase (thermoresistant glucokinase family)
MNLQSLSSKKSLYILVMGVSGSGKSTIALELSNILNLPFIEGDDFHPESNRQKLMAGIPLNDDDRIPWLEDLAKSFSGFSEGCVLACSALKDSYRKILFRNISIHSTVLKVVLDANPEILSTRMKNRNHFMPVSLLESQLATLEISPDLLIIDSTQSVNSIITQIMQYLTKLTENEI